MNLSFVLSMAGLGKSLGTVDWCVATACHYVMYCLPVDDSSVRSGVAVILVYTTFSPGCIVVDDNSVRSGQLQLSSVFGQG